MRVGSPKTTSYAQQSINSCYEDATIVEKFTQWILPLHNIHMHKSNDIYNENSKTGTQIMFSKKFKITERLYKAIKLEKSG